MAIVKVESRIETVAWPKSRSLPQVDDAGSSEPADVRRLVVNVHDDSGTIGRGYALVDGSGRAEQLLLDELFAPLVQNADAVMVERVYGKCRHRCPAIGLGGVESRSYAALDVALWDLLGQNCKQPLHRLLGGARDSATCHIAATAWPELSARRVIEIAKPLLDQGIHGLRVGVASRDPLKDAAKLQRIRDELGEQVWFGVQCQQGLDLQTALAFGRFLEEEMDADLFADPCPAHDVDAYARLADVLEVPIAVGSTLGSAAFAAFAQRTRVGIFQVEIGRVGGITPLLKVADLAEMHHRVVMPIGSTDIATQLACGRASIVNIDYLDVQIGPNGPKLETGKLSP